MNAEIVYKGARRDFGFRYSGPEWIFIIIVVTAIIGGIGMIGMILLKTLG